MKRFVIAALAMALAGCANTDTTAPQSSFDASFTLRTINGSPVPYTFASGNTLQSDVLTMFSDGTYSDVAQYSNGQVIAEQGFYTNNNGAITFTEQSGSAQYQGSLSGSVLTEIVSGLTEVYQKN